MKSIYLFNKGKKQSGYFNHFCYVLYFIFRYVKPRLPSAIVQPFYIYEVEYIHRKKSFRSIKTNIYFHTCLLFSVHCLYRKIGLPLLSVKKYLAFFVISFCFIKWGHETLFFLYQQLFNGCFRVYE